MNPSKAAVSNAYMDANGIGKVITISEAVFQALPKIPSNISCESLENLLGGCPCTRYGAYKRLAPYLFCLTWSRLVTVQICYTSIWPPCYFMTSHAIASLCVIMYCVSRCVMFGTSSRRRSESLALCYVASEVFVKLFEHAVFFANLIVNFPNRLRLEAT